ncbi:MAG: DUF4384 domain-containing protein [Leptospiraceae bacterium]|nr:DUF4384 domain-containing protein [Leptospiraceae bacterium]
MNLLFKRFFQFILFAFISTSIVSANKLNVAVVGGDGDSRSQIENKLLSTELFQPVERTKIEKLFKELKLGQTGFLKEGSYPKAGEFLGVHYLIILDETGKNFRLVHSGSSKILGSWPNLRTDSIEDLIQLLEKEKSLQELARLQSSRKNDFEIEITNSVGSRDMGGAKFGDELFLEMIVNSKTEKYTYITILVYGQDGSVMQLFPNKYQSDNKVETNKEFQFPAADSPKKYKLIASPPAGEDTLVIIASNTPTVMDDKASTLGIYKGSENSFSQTKGISLQLDKTNSKYGIERVIFEIREK